MKLTKQNSWLHDASLLDTDDSPSSASRKSIAFLESKHKYQASDIVSISIKKICHEINHPKGKEDGNLILHTISH